MAAPRKNARLRVSVVIPAAGRGRRFGGRKNKVLLPLAGKPVIGWSLETFSRLPEVVEILIPCAARDRNFLETWMGRRFPKTRLVPGGAERFDSVGNALRLCSPQSDLVAIHDAARPFVEKVQIREAFRMARRYGGAILAIPLADTVKSSQAGHFIEKTLPREILWRAQTPQVFRRVPFLRAYEKAVTRGIRTSDDAAVAEREGIRVALVLGSERNFKITTREQLHLAARLC